MWNHAGDVAGLLKVCPMLRICPMCYVFVCMFIRIVCFLLCDYIFEPPRAKRVVLGAHQSATLLWGPTKYLKYFFKMWFLPFFHYF